MQISVVTCTNFVISRSMFTILVVFMPEVLALSLHLGQLENVYIHRLSLESTPFYFLRYHLQESFPALGSFGVQFGDHLRACTGRRLHEISLSPPILNFCLFGPKPVHGKQNLNWFPFNAIQPTQGEFLKLGKNHRSTG